MPSISICLIWKHHLPLGCWLEGRGGHYIHGKKRLNSIPVCFEEIPSLLIMKWLLLVYICGGKRGWTLSLFVFLGFRKWFPSHGWNNGLLSYIHERRETTFPFYLLGFPFFPFQWMKWLLVSRLVRRKWLNSNSVCFYLAVSSFPLMKWWWLWGLHLWNKETEFPFLFFEGIPFLFW